MATRPPLDTFFKTRPPLSSFKKPEAHTFDVPENRTAKISRYQEEARQSAEEAKKAKSPLGFLKNAFSSDAAEGLPFIGGALGLAKSANKALTSGAEFDQKSKEIETLTSSNVLLLRRIRENENAGKDSTKLKQIYNEQQAQIGKLNKEIGQTQSELPTTQQVVGQGLRTVLDAATAGTYSKAAQTFKPLKPIFGSKSVPTVIQKGQQLLEQPAKSFSRNGLSRLGITTAESTGIGYSYDVALGLEGARGEDRTGAKAFIPGAGTVLGVAAPAVLTGLSKTPVLRSAITKEGRAAQRATQAEQRAIQESQKTDSIITKREEEIFNIENNYAKTRKAQDYSKDSGSASRKRVASTDVLVDAVDENGLIRTKQPGGAVEQYRKLTIDDAEDVVLKGLEKEGASAKVTDVQRYLESNIENSNLTMDEKVAARNSIRRIIAGFKSKYPDGNIPLTELQLEKIRTTQNIDYTNSSSRIRQKAVGNAYKTLIEDKSSLPIKDINGELGKYYEDITLLENLDGKRVKGGRLGNYFSRITGGVAGSIAGNAIGGPVGSVVGAGIGSEVASRIQSKFMRNVFGGEAGLINAKSKVLEDAIQRNSTPRLMLPAPEKGAPRKVVGSGTPILVPPKGRNIEIIGRNDGQWDLNRNINDPTKTPTNIAPTNVIDNQTLPQSNKLGKLIGDQNSQTSRGLDAILGGTTKTPQQPQSIQSQPVLPYSSIEDANSSVLPQAEPQSNALGKLSADVKNTPAFKNFERDAALTGDDALVQERSIEKYLTKKDELLEEYLSGNGRVVNTDEARKVFKDVGYVGANARAVQEPSSALAKDAWRHLLKNSDSPDVLIYAGGSGTGKTSAVKHLLAEEIGGAGAILDGNLSSMKSAQARIQEAIDAGKEPTIVYVYRDPVDAWVEGVIKRMKGNAEEGGRIVPLSVFIQNHKGSHNVVKELLNSKNNGVLYNAKLVDNSLGRGNQALLSKEKFDSIRYTEDLKEKLIAETKKLYEQGQITKAQYEELIK